LPPSSRLELVTVLPETSSASSPTRKAPQGTARDSSVDMAGTQNAIGLKVGGHSTLGATPVGLSRTSIPSPMFPGATPPRFVRGLVQNQEDWYDYRPTWNGIWRQGQVRRLCISQAARRQVLRVMPTLQTDRCCERLEIPGMLREGSHSTMATRLPLRLVDSGRMHGDSTTCSATCSNGALLPPIPGHVAVHTTMALTCVVKKLASGERNRTAGMRISVSA